jgi:hypothetical protein
MAKPDGCSDVQQLRTLRGGERARVDSERLGRTPEQRRVPRRVGRRQQHQSLRRLRQCAKAPQVVVLDVTGEISRGGKFKATCELRWARAPRQLQQSERVATSLGDDPVADAVVESARYGSRQQGARSLPVQPSERQLGQALELVLVTWLANGEHDRDRLRQQPSRDESEHLARGRIEPCASSTNTSSGRSSATADKRLSTPRATRKRSGVSPDDRPNATLKASL